MNSKDYILKHDFGYCREPELENLIKLELRNFEDVKFYVEWSIREFFAAKISKDNVIQFSNSKNKTQVLIERLWLWQMKKSKKC